MPACAAVVCPRRLGGLLCAHLPLPVFYGRDPQPGSPPSVLRPQPAGSPEAETQVRFPPGGLCPHQHRSPSRAAPCPAGCVASTAWSGMEKTQSGVKDVDHARGGGGPAPEQGSHGTQGPRAQAARAGWGGPGFCVKLCAELPVLHRERRDHDWKGKRSGCCNHCFNSFPLGYFPRLPAHCPRSSLNI